MRQRTEPLPPPEGFKWAIKETAILVDYKVEPVFSLGLWPQEAETRSWDGPVAESLFTKETQIRSASKEALKAYAQSLVHKRLADHLTHRSL